MPELRDLIILSVMFVLLVTALRVVLGTDAEVVSAYTALVAVFSAIVSRFVK